MKYREFWIADTEKYWCMECGGNICYDKLDQIKHYQFEGNTHHVIEYAALEKANKKIKDLEQEIKNLNYGIDVLKERLGEY
jgi:hypothetical protein